MKQQKTYICSTILVIILLSASSWLKDYQPVSPAENYGETRIGNQVWMTHNLNTVTFRNGDTIPQARTKAEWRKANSKKQPAWCYYNNDSANGPVYGRLYNWSAVNDKRGLAPAGWHIPSGREWRVLYNFLGGKDGKAGRKLKNTAGWGKEGNGENTFGFNGLPAGVRTLDITSPNNGFRWMGTLTVWWSTTKPKNWSDIECFVIRGTDKAVFEWIDSFDGCSVRCVKD